MNLNEIYYFDSFTEQQQKKTRVLINFKDTSLNQFLFILAHFVRFSFFLLYSQRYVFLSLLEVDLETRPWS